MAGLEYTGILKKNTGDGNLKDSNKNMLDFYEIKWLLWVEMSNSVGAIIDRQWDNGKASEK